jgi:FkbM family methyltransferase
MEKIIHLTIRDPNCPTPLQAEVIDRARKLHPNWSIQVWGDPDPGTGGEFLLESYLQKANSGAQLADLIRLDVIHAYGGVYLDADLILHKPLDALVERYQFFICSENGTHLTNAVFGARSHNPALRDLIDVLLNREPDWTLPANVTTGPDLFTRVLRWREDFEVLPRETFYPYPPFTIENGRVHRHSFGEHLWDFSWKPKLPGVGPVAPKQPTLFHRKVQKARELGKVPLKAAVRYGFRIRERIRRLDPAATRIAPRQKCYPICDELVAESVHGYRMVLDGRDLSITPEQVFNGYYELSEQLFLKEVLSGGDWVIDVGANVGTFSLLAAQAVGPFGRVYCFEPNARPMELMKKSFAMNWMHERARFRQVAAGAAHSTVRLATVSDRLGDSRIVTGGPDVGAFSRTLALSEPNGRSVTVVDCVRLDDEFSVDLPIKVLKIDAEGYEGHVLAGASRLLKNRAVDYVMLELLAEVSGGEWPSTLDEVRKVADYGYSINSIGPEGILVSHEDVTEAVNSAGRNIVLRALDQYRASPIIA